MQAEKAGSSLYFFFGRHSVSGRIGVTSVPTVAFWHSVVFNWRSAVRMVLKEFFLAYVFRALLGDAFGG